MAKEVRVRNAPSPTGYLHIGSVRTFLYNYLFARKNNGKYILRIEDTDRERLVPGSVENIVESLALLGITTDEGPYWDNGVVKYRGDKGPYIQSQRLELYKKYADELVTKKAAYYCFCTKERLEELRKSQEAQKLPHRYDKHCLQLSADEVDAKIKKGVPHIIRLNVPTDRTITFKDKVYGEIKVASRELDDQVLLKSDGFPTYHLAVVVDDHLMKISHIIRGDEWIPSTPKHILLYEAFGWELPVFVHLPPILSKKTRKKLSKREGDVAVKGFLEKGYLPEALVNFLALLGWNPKTVQEIFNIRELVDEFSLEKINKAGAFFDYDKLDWFNSQYIRSLKIEELFARIVPHLVKARIEIGEYPKEFLEKIILLERERLKKLSEIGERVQYFFNDPEYDPSMLIWKEFKPSEIKDRLSKVYEHLSSLNDSWWEETAKTNVLKEQIGNEIFSQVILKNKYNVGSVLWPLRVALTGLEASPGPFEIIDAFGALPNGKEVVLRRINKAAEQLYDKS